MNTNVLFEPVRINKLTLGNRFVMGPMAVLSPHADGRASEQTMAFLETRAKGGVGMIIVSGCGSQRCADEYATPMLRLDVEEFLPDLKRVAEAVHTHGVPIFAEISVSFGRMGVATSSQSLISASAKGLFIPQDVLPKGLVVPGGVSLPVPKAASIDEIRELEEACVASALRVRRAGWDGVEIPAHGSYFMGSFLSPRTNSRTDEYGGSPENRARIVSRIVRAIRVEAGSDFPIGLRISCDEPVDGGQGPEGFAVIARILVEAGVDYVALVDGCSERMDRIFSGSDGGMTESGAARTFKKSISVPILLQGLHDPMRAADAIAQGHGDMIMLSRPLLVDPNYPNKLRGGQVDAIVRCNRENHCLHRTMVNLPVRCPLNPVLGNESHGQDRAAPINRLLTASREQAVMKLSGSGLVMGPAIKALRRGKKE